jgi:hypothetical protein
MIGFGRRIWGYKQGLLFLKKKKQKDFIHLMRRGWIPPHQTNESFLVLFFKKEHAYLTASATSASDGNAPDLRLEYFNAPSTVISNTPPLDLRSVTWACGLREAMRVRAARARAS